MKDNQTIKTEEEVLRAVTPAPENDLHFQLMMAELVDQLQEPGLAKRQSSIMHKMVARYGDAYFFYNSKGEFCLLTGFLQR